MKDLGNLNNWTKTDLSRVIAKRLMNLDVAPKADNPTVRQLVKNHLKSDLVALAEKAINQID